MSKYNRYVLSTTLYILVVILSVLFFIWAVYAREWFLAGLLFLMAGVSLDNVFCGTRARAAGCSIKGHYVLPQFKRK